MQVFDTREQPSKLVHRGVPKIHPIGDSGMAGTEEAWRARPATDDSFVCSYALARGLIRRSYEMSGRQSMPRLMSFCLTRISCEAAVFRSLLHVAASRSATARRSRAIQWLIMTSDIAHEI
jgi:hypothetical protein